MKTTQCRVPGAVWAGAKPIVIAMQCCSVTVSETIISCHKRHSGLACTCRDAEKSDDQAQALPPGHDFSLYSRPICLAAALLCQVPTVMFCVLSELRGAASANAKQTQRMPLECAWGVPVHAASEMAQMLQLGAIRARWEGLAARHSRQAAVYSWQATGLVTGQHFLAGIVGRTGFPLDVQQAPSDGEYEVIESSFLV